MFEDVTTKDWIGFGYSFLTSVVAVTALYRQIKSDRRRDADLLPYAEIELPAMDGVGPSKASFLFRNRSDRIVVVESMSTLLTSPVLILTKDDDIARHDTAGAVFFSKGRRHLPLNIELAPGAEESGHIVLHPLVEKRLGNNLPIDFRVVGFCRGAERKSYRLNIRRTANP